MKCSKCGGEVKNLPEYIEETATEVLCAKCAGTTERNDDAVMTLDNLRYGKSYVGAERELEIAA